MGKNDKYADNLTNRRLGRVGKKKTTSTSKSKSMNSRKNKKIVQVGCWGPATGFYDPTSGKRH